LITVELLLSMLLVTVAAAEDRPQRPPFEEIAAVVNRHFARRGDFLPKDLIHQSLVRDALGEVARAGWDVTAADEIVEKTLSDDSFLARTFSQPAGRSFLRKVAAMPGAYRQLDQLSSTNDGEKHIEHLIRQKDGYLLVKYLTTTQGGRNLGRQMSRVPRGVDLNRPTNRIYTVQELLAELQAAYAAQP
jgi:hypothetical protein